jgi:hypothetical protein
VHVLDRLRAELGPPFRRGDGCRWTLADTDGTTVMRITIFLDGSADSIDGWLWATSQLKAERLRIVTLQDLELLLTRCRCARTAAASTGNPSPPAAV